MAEESTKHPNVEGFYNGFASLDKFNVFVVGFDGLNDYGL